MGGIPSKYEVDIDVLGPVELAGTVGLAGLPTNYHLDIDKLPKIQIGIDPITINPITFNPVTLNPLDISVSVKEVPSIRAHVPANFSVAFSLLGVQLACIRLCGEAQVITEPYVPNPCELCGPTSLAPVQDTGTVTPADGAASAGDGKV